MIIRSSTHSFFTEFDAVLVEETVLLRFRSHPEERRFRRERDFLYELADAAEREKRFQDLHSKWFLQLALHRPIVETLQEYPSLTRAARSCRVSRTSGAEQETADLHDLYDPNEPGPGPQRAILIRVRPERLLDTTNLVSWLHRELLYLADIVDPEFGYQRVFPLPQAEATRANLVRERYRVLWNTWVDGRLFGRGKLGEAARECTRQEFLATFAMLGLEAENWFERLWESERETHAGLLTLASEPRASLPVPSGSPASAGVCPLCRFPSFDWVEESSPVLPDLEKEIRSDFPNWRPDQGLCRQCADLYRARLAASVF